MIEQIPLPTPGTPDVWERIRTERRPIAVYGMGNGAEKLLDRLADMGITPVALFASDGFVRGQSFRGYRVERYAEVVERCGDPVILLAFATRQPDMLRYLGELAEKHTLLLPDMPVAGEEYFTSAFYAAHYDEICAVYSLLEDNLSKSTFSSIIQYKLTGDIKPLLSVFSTPAEDYACLGTGLLRLAVDGGAYNGDTVRELLFHRPDVGRIIAVEPDARNYKKLSEYAKDAPVPVTAVQAALGSREGTVELAAAGSRNSSLHGASYKARRVSVPLTTVDKLAGDNPVDFIKYDVEGAEEDALRGSLGVILRDRPTLAVSVYHRSRDIFRLPLLLREWMPDCRLYLRRRACLPAWEITLYAV